MSSSSDEDEIVRLNVGGRSFVTTRSTLLMDPSSMLAAMFSGNHQPGLRDATGALFIDRSPRHFEAVLEFLRTGRVALESPAVAEGLFQEAEFYQVTALLQLLRRRPPADLCRGDLVRAQVSGQLKTLASLRLVGLDLAGMDLTGLSFERSDLSEACFDGAVLQGAQLCGCRGERASFRGAFGDHLNCAGAVMAEAVFDGAALKSAVFSSAKLRGASFAGAKAANGLFQKAVLTGANFSRAVLTDAHFQDADLRGANLSGAVLANVHFAGADLRDVAIDWAAVEEYSLRGAKMTMQQFAQLPVREEVKHQMRICVLDRPLDPVLQQQIHSFVTQHPFVIYGQTFDARFSAQLLTSRMQHLRLPLTPVQIVDVDAPRDLPLMDTLTQLNNGHNRFPMVYIGGHYVGTWTALKELDSSHQLDDLIQRAVAATSTIAV